MALKPLGSRIWVQDIVESLSIEQRAEAAGFVVIVNDNNRPKSTKGKVVAIGSDPMLHELIKVGDVVFFRHTAGDRIMHGELELRSLEWQEVIGVDDGN